jgi:hypothetical protein
MPMRAIIQKQPLNPAVLLCGFLLMTNRWI